MINYNLFYGKIKSNICIFLQYGRTALNYAASQGQTATVALLLDRGAEVNKAGFVSNDEWLFILRLDKE